MGKAILIEIAKYIQTAKLDSECGIIWTVNEKKELQHLADVRGWGHIQNMFKTEQEAMDFQDAIGQFIVDAVNEKITSLTAPVPDGKLPELEIEEWPIDVDPEGNVEESEWMAGLKGTPIMATAITKEKAIDELMISIRVALLHDYNSKLTKTPDAG